MPPAVLEQGPLSYLPLGLFQEVLPPELLDLLVLTLCQQAPAFATSLSFAKLVTAMLTVYQSQVSEARLSSCSSWHPAQSSQVGSWQGSALSSCPLHARSPQLTGAVWLLSWTGAMQH